MVPIAPRLASSSFLSSGASNEPSPAPIGPAVCAPGGEVLEQTHTHTQTPLSQLFFSDTPEEIFDHNNFNVKALKPLFSTILNISQASILNSKLSRFFKWFCSSSVLDTSMFIHAFSEAWWYLRHGSTPSTASAIAVRDSSYFTTPFRWFSPPVCLGCGHLSSSASVGCCLVSSLGKSYTRKTAKVTLDQIPSFGSKSQDPKVRVNIP